MSLFNDKIQGEPEPISFSILLCMRSSCNLGQSSRCCPRMLRKANSVWQALLWSSSFYSDQSSHQWGVEGTKQGPLTTGLKKWLQGQWGSQNLFINKTSSLLWKASISCLQSNVLDMIHIQPFAYTAILDSSVEQINEWTKAFSNYLMFSHW